MNIYKKVVFFGKDIFITEREGAIERIGFSAPAEGTEADSPLLTNAAKQLEEYLSGKRKSFDLPIRLICTDFQRRVLEELLKVGYGEITTYKALAERIGMPNAARAAGGALNRNPIAIVFPCHRAIGSDGSLTGYAGGTEIKRRLIELEKNFS